MTPRLTARPQLTLIAIIAFAGMLWIIVSADRRTLPGWIMALYNFPGGDKVGHLILFGGLTALADLALGGRPIRPGSPLPLAAVTIALLETIEEISQSFFPSRTLSVLDLAASYLGIVLGTLVARAVRRRRMRKVG